MTATDDVDGDVTSSVTVSGTVDTSAAGDYTITYTVTDRRATPATAERTVTVKKADKSSRIYLTFDDGPSRASRRAFSTHSSSTARKRRSSSSIIPTAISRSSSA